MHRQWHMIAVSLSVAACAQIAGFEQLSPKKLPSEGGGGGGGFAGALSSGGSGGALGGARAGDGGDLQGAAGNVNVGNNGGAPPTSGTSGSSASGGGTGGSGFGGAEVVGGCNAQQLRNAHFDRGAVDWTHESRSPGILRVEDVILQKDSVRLTTAQVAPHSGSHLAWLGGRANSEETTIVNLLQQVEIPENVSNLIVSGWIRIKTAEPVVADSHDQLDIALQDADDFWTFHVWYVDAASDEWQPFEYQADDPQFLDVLRGRTVTFILESKTDTSYDTHFWVDSLRFVAECP